MSARPTHGHARIEAFSRARHQLAMTFALDDLRFSTSIWYDDVDLYELEARFGAGALEKVYAHIAAFEVNKLASLRARTLDLGPFARFHTVAFERVWRAVLKGVWAQWRYENDLPDDAGPIIVNPVIPSLGDPLHIVEGTTKTLAFCGGGKDSLVAMKLLERAEIPFATNAYAHSIYGAAAPQHALIQNLLDHASPTRRHRQWIYDDLTDSPVLDLAPEYGSRSMTAAETPASIFAAIPIALAHGYTRFVLAHERSANVGNLIWEKTGEDVNHQWGKSLEAERLISQYVQAEIASNLDYFSILQPVYDVVIFRLLGRDLGAVPATHSCNIRKPWCMKCPKCAYVWLGYRAHLPEAVVRSMFPVDLTQMPENEIHFRRMLGLESHTPFECIGQIDEARLALELCRSKGLDDPLATRLRGSLPELDLAAVLDEYTSIDAAPAELPADVATRVVPDLQAAAIDARIAIERELGPRGSVRQ